MTLQNENINKMDGNIFLIGFMGAGKSTVARQLHKAYGMEQLEMDQMIVEQQGMPIAAIFEQHGETFFRDLESRLLVEMQQKHNAVVSCGGGAVLREENVQTMKQNGKIVLLTATPETIYNRVKDSKDRPILNGNMTVCYIKELMEKRREKYETAADIVIATDGKTTSQICEEIISNMIE